MYQFPCRSCATNGRLVYIRAENLSEVISTPLPSRTVKTWRYNCPVCNYYEDTFLPLGEENV